MADWDEFLDLSGVNLEQSYLLALRQQDGNTLLELDVQLTSEHPLFEPPRPAESGCYRPAELIFSATTKLLAPKTDTLSGQINHIVATGDGQYTVEGDFGKIIIASETPFLRLTEN